MVLIDWKNEQGGEAQGGKDMFTKLLLRNVQSRWVCPQKLFIIKSTMGEKPLGEELQTAHRTSVEIYNLLVVTLFNLFSHVTSRH